MGALDQMADAVFVTFPGLGHERAEDGLTVVRNDALGSRLPCPAPMLRLLEAFARPRALREALAVETVTTELVLTAITHLFLVRADMLMPSAAMPIGPSQRLSQFLQEPPEGATILFGAPTDSATTGQAGTREGPREIRGAFSLSLEGGVDVFKAGFQSIGSDEPTQVLDFDMRRRYLRLPRLRDIGDLRNIPGESIETFGARLSELTSWIVERGGVPAMLGGDHSTTWFVLRQLLKHHGALGVIHFDAHPDVWPHLTPQLRHVTHAHPFTFALESERLKVLHQVGLRISEPVLPGLLRADPRVTYVSARQAQTMSAADVFKHLPRDLAYYLSFDVDCLDPAWAPETGTPVAGGLSYYQATDLIDYATREFNLVGFDLVEVGAPTVRPNRAALAAAGCVRAFLMGGLPFEPLTAYCP